MNRHRSWLISTFAAVAFAFSSPGAVVSSPQDPATGPAAVSIVPRHGPVVELPLASGDDRYIIELDGTPILDVDPRRRVAARESAQERLDRFERDLRDLARSAKISQGPAIERRFSMTLLAVAARIPESLVGDVQRLPNVRSVSRTRSFRAQLGGSIPQIRADQVWNQLGTRGRGVVVAVIDTGIDYRHSHLGGGIGPGFKVAGGYDFVNDDIDPIDDNGHGTHVSGIIAAEGDHLRGVAPEATLLAYKALDNTGQGSDETIIASIERSVDPNGDGNPSDAVDIVNMSLGGMVTADDPLVHAVETATRAGVLFCIAAGNAGAVNSISSPGTAPSAITVGAIDRFERIAGFSSRGPSRLELLIKPEIVAPGVDIQSTTNGGAFGRMSGTSMATPHVAGVAALLKSLHHDWTPLQLKSAIVGTASDLGYDVMEQGAGLVDALAAATTTITSEPSTVNFGLADVNATWSKTESITITNRGSSTVTLSATAECGASSVSTLVDPATLALEPGQSGVIRLTVSIAQGSPPSPLPSTNAIGGTVTLAGGSARLRIPWSFLYAVRVSTDTLVLIADERQEYWMSPGLEAVVAPGRYDAVAVQQIDDARFGIIVREGVTIENATSLSFRSTDARFTLRFDATDEAGTPLPIEPPTEKTLHYGLLRLVFPSGSAAESLYFVGDRQYTVSAISDRFSLLPAELHVDLNRDAVYALQHRRLTGIDGDVSLSLGAADLVRQDVDLDLRQGVAWIGGTDERELMPMGMRKELGAAGPWTGHAFLSRGDRDAATFGPIFATGSGVWTRVDARTPVLRSWEGQIAAFRGAAPSPSTPFSKDGESIPVGDLPLHLRTEYTSRETRSGSTQIELTPRYFGPIDEELPFDAALSSCRVLRPGQAEVLCSKVDGDSTSFVTSLPDRGAYTIQVWSWWLRPLHAKGTLVNELDTSKDDAFPPTVTSLSLRDGERLLGSTIENGARVTLRFSGADFVSTDGRTAYEPIPTDRVRACYHKSGTVAWICVPVTLVDEESADPLELGRAPIGKLFEADFTGVANVPGLIDVRVSIEDDSGNSAEWTLAPAFQVEGRRRQHPVRR